MTPPKQASRALLRLLLLSLGCGLVSALLGISLKHLTEHFEHRLSKAAQLHPVLYFLLPLAAFSLIFYLRRLLFFGKTNKGIKEIFLALKHHSARMPLFKIPSHYVNGLITVAAGGATGIEVSTVVATATIGSVTHRKGKVHMTFRREMICAAVAAGVTALFGSPIAGILFSYEVISRRWNKFAFMSIVTAALGASGLLYLLREQPLFVLKAGQWHTYALPFFVILAGVAALFSVYLTRCVLYCKKKMGSRLNPFFTILAGSLLLGCALLLLPQLYGDGYASMQKLIADSDHLLFPLGLAFVLVLVKGPVTAITLAAGGDGGVFAPALFVGAFLGYIVAYIGNHYFQAEVIPLNFVLAGMAAVLSGSLHAPFTAAFLVVGLTGNFGLLMPLLLCALVALWIAKRLFPYTVYSYVGS